MAGKKDEHERYAILHGQRQHVGKEIADTLPRIGGPSPGASVGSLPHLGGPEPSAPAAKPSSPDKRRPDKR